MNPMARSVAMLIVKWLLIPAALTAVGYYIVGPRIGASLKNSAAAEPTKSSSATETTTAANTVSYPAPDVEVKVNSTAPKKRPKRHKPRGSKRRPQVRKPAAETPSTPPPVDQGGSGGAATTGGDGGSSGGDGGSTGGGDQSGAGQP